ncbi:MAG TPA: Holliday junction resolvase RuvX [Ktedonobacteraceae bacterium]|nr:Holliday junction resolvase RuvX [Ktedonobacteraceae bacterium]
MPRLMALDVGEARIGIALSDASGFLASPYTTLHVSRDETQIWLSLQKLIEETEAEGLVIGLPISLDGEIHAQAEQIIAFTERLKAQISLPIVFWDERLSTVEAERLLTETGQSSRGYRQGKSRGKEQHGKSKRKRRGQQEIDALAAAVILQEYLDRHPEQREAQSSQTEDNT